MLEFIFLTDRINIKTFQDLGFMFLTTLQKYKINSSSVFLA